MGGDGRGGTFWKIRGTHDRKSGAPTGGEGVDQPSQSEGLRQVSVGGRLKVGREQKALNGQFKHLDLIQRIIHRMK